MSTLTKPSKVRPLDFSAKTGDTRVSSVLYGSEHLFGSALLVMNFIKSTKNKVHAMCWTIANLTRTVLSHVKRRLDSAITAHFVVAFALASSLLLLEHNGLLGWADAIMLRLNSVITDTPTEQETTIPSESAQQPPLVVIELDQPFYEKHFHARSPLDRGVLAWVLKGIVDAQPRKVIVDIDLSPIPGGDAGQDELDSVLEKSHPLLCADDHAKECGVIVLEPFWYDREEYNGRQYDWFKRMCAQGIRFGDGWLPEHFGYVVRYYDSSYGISRLAFDMEKPSLCALPRPYFSRKNRAESLATLPYNLRGKRYIEVLTASEIFTHDELRADARSKLHSSVVFVGGSYGLDDKHDLAGEDKDGVFLHALSFYSLMNPVVDVAHHKTLQVAAFVLDTVIGMALGAIFLATWGWYNRARHGYYRALAPGFKQRLVRYVYMEFALIMNVAFLLVLIAFFAWACGRMYEHDVWLNPAPLMIGMFIHSLLESKEVEDMKADRLSFVDLRTIVLLVSSIIISVPLLMGGH